jgi:hypothetical protein
VASRDATGNTELKANQLFAQDFSMTQRCIIRSRLINALRLYENGERTMKTYRFSSGAVISMSVMEKEWGSKMKTYTLIGIILIVIGVIAFAYQGFTYTTTEKVVDLGPIHVTAEKQKTIPLPPIIGGIALAGGVVMLVMGNKKS